MHATLTEHARRRFGDEYQAARNLRLHGPDWDDIATGLECRAAAIEEA